MIRRLTFVAAASLTLAVVARAQLSATGGTAVLRGTVMDDANDHRLAGATIAIEILRLQVLTDSTGNFALRSIPAGRHIVIVKRLGYRPISSVLNFGPRDTLEYDFGMTKMAAELPGVEVRAAAPPPPRLAEFEERRKLGGGRFITPDVLEKMKNDRMSVVLSTIPGPRVAYGTSSAAWIAATRGSGSILRGASPISEMDRRKGANPTYCYAAVMLDGAYVYQGQPGEMLFDINSIATTAVQAIEYYTEATMPIKYRSSGITCGLVIIWTK